MRVDPFLVRREERRKMRRKEKTVNGKQHLRRQEKNSPTERERERERKNRALTETEREREREVKN